MSYGDPNNPYGQPPQQPPAQPGYGYPQQAPPSVPPQQGYGYPQQQPGYPGYSAYPGGNPMQQTMPGLLVTARVFLFIISAVQIIGALGYLYVAAIANDISDTADDFGSSAGSDFADVAAGVGIVVALILGGLAALSITLAVKFGSGGQGIRVTTIVYGALGCVAGLIFLFVGLDTGMASAVIFPLLWVVFGAIITAAPAVSSGTAWFARPRY